MIDLQEMEDELLDEVDLEESELDTEEKMIQKRYNNIRKGSHKCEKYIYGSFYYWNKIP